MRKMVNVYLPLFTALIIVIAISGCVTMRMGDSTAKPIAAPFTAWRPSASQPESTPPTMDDRGHTVTKNPLSPAGRVLTLGQCVGIALSRNPLTRESWQRARAAAAATGQARSAYLPSADFSAGANRADQVILDSSRDTGAADTFNAGFEASYLLFDGGARAAGLRGARADLLAANLAHNATLLDVALQVTEAYYQLLAARELRQQAARTLRQTQYHVDMARARHQNGLAARSDVLRAETEKADANLQMVRARGEVRLARGQLANAMGLSPIEPLKVAELPANNEQFERQNIKHFIKEAEKQRPELRAALAGLEAKRAQIQTAKSRYRPTITVNTDYGWRDRSLIPNRDEWSLGLGLNWPLFEGFNRQYTVRRARADLAASAAGYEKLLRGVELEVWTAYVRLTEAGQAIEAARALVASAGESARVTEGEYKNGTASIIETIDAQTARTAANVSLVRARLDWHTALARLKRALGRQTASPEKQTLAEKNP
ncbi:TolC family protein [Desulfobacterota bacterium M19]